MRMTISTIAAVALAISPAASAAKVVISYQTELSAVAHHIALDKGYYEELGLEVEMKWYPSGAPQVKAAVESKAWDFGGAGVVPNIIGGPQGIIGVGISMDQSATNQLVGNAEGVALWPPKSMQGIPIALSPNSTGDYVVQACLRSQGFNIEDVEFIYEQQPGVIEALTGNGNTSRAPLGGLWAPNTYALLDSVEGSKTLCSGASVYTTVTGGHMARREWAEENPELVAKILAGWLRAVEFINNEEANKEEVLHYMAAFFQKHDIEIPRKSLELDLRLVGLFDLPRQLELMERRGEPPLSNYDIWTNEVGNFMLENGVISTLTDPTTYIDDNYMKMVSEDPVLRAWALGQEVLIEAEENSGASTCAQWLFAVASICLLSAVGMN